MSAADHFLKALVDAKKSNNNASKELTTTTRRSRSAGANKNNRRQNHHSPTAQQQEEERRRLKSAAATAELAKERERILFPDTDTGLGAALNLRIQQQHANARRRAASASHKRRFLKSRGRSDADRTTTDPFFIPGCENIDKTHTTPLPIKSSSVAAQLFIDHTTTLLQLQQHDQLEAAHYQQIEFDLNGRKMTPSSISSTTTMRKNFPVETQVFDDNDQSRDLYEAYASTVAHESQLRHLQLASDNQERDTLLKELRIKLAAHIDKANALLMRVAHSSANGSDSTPRAKSQKSLTGTYNHIKANIAAEKVKAQADTLPQRADPVAIALQRISAGQHQRNELLQAQRELNGRLEHVLTYATPREEKVAYDRSSRSLELDRLDEQRNKMVERQIEDREHVMHLKRQVKEMKRLLQAQQDELSKVRLAWELATGTSAKDGNKVDDEDDGISKASSLSINGPPQYSSGRSLGTPWSEGYSPTRGRGSTRGSTRGSEIGLIQYSNSGKEDVSVVARDVHTTSPDHMRETLHEGYVAEVQLDSIKEQDLEGDDAEDKAWKQARKAIVIPQDYINTQYIERLRQCATSFAVIMAEAKQISKCDYCKKMLDAPRITRACSHCVCLKCLYKGQEEESEEEGEDGDDEQEDENADAGHEHDDGEHGEDKDKVRVAEVDNADAKKINNKKVAPMNATKRVPVGTDIICPVCDTETQARADHVLKAVLQKMQVFFLSTEL